MHRDLFKELQEAIDNGTPDNLAYAAPRGNAKSTIASFALPIWCALYKKKHYIIIISDTADQANDFLSNIRNELEDNERILSDFGDQVGYVWQNSDLILKNDIRIQALGAGKKIRGRRYKQYRPDLIIADDLENDENINSPDQRKKDEMWYTKAVSKSGDERTDKVVIGTIMHYDSLLSKLLKNPIYKTRKYQSVLQWSASSLWADWERIITDLEDPDHINNAQAFYEANKEAMLVGTKVLWPAKEDYINLMIQKVADGPAAFSSEKQNEPLSDDDRRFLPEWIQYYDDADIVGRELFIVGAVDPSMGKQGGDYSAIVTLGMDTNQMVFVLEADIAKRHPDVIVEDVISKNRIFDYKSFGVEQNQFQEYFKDTLIHRSEELGIDIPIKGIKTHSDKVLRVQSLQPDIKNGRVKFRRDQQKLIEQLINFPSADHDDGPDCLELAMGMLGRRSALAEYYKAQANESKKANPISFLQDPSLQRIT